MASVRKGAFCTLLRHTETSSAQLGPHSYSQSLQAGSLSVLISSDLLLADNTGNKEQYAFWHVCGFFPLIFHPKEKDREEGKKVSSLLQASIVLELSETKARRTVTITADTSFMSDCILPYLQAHLNLQWTSQDRPCNGKHSLPLDEQH